jgi:hypothetical protein
MMKLESIQPAIMTTKRQVNSKIGVKFTQNHLKYPKKSKKNENKF